MQRILVLLIVIGTIFYLGKKIYDKINHKDSGCDNCGLKN